MINIIRFEELGKADYGWLKANYHFNFATYYNPNRNGYGPLCVWNDDTISPGKGFPDHPHENMEIITYVRSGAITHKDSMGNQGRTEAGSIQVMSAGTGILHSEYNLEEIDTTLFQIWIKPNIQNISPRWETKTISDDWKTQCLPFASGKEEYIRKGCIKLHQDVTLWICRAKKGDSLTFPGNEKSELYGVLNFGKLSFQEQEINSRDAIYIHNEADRIANVLDDIDLIAIEL